MAEAKEKWVEIILSTPPELTDALSNFMVELDTQGVFQEENEPDAFNNAAPPAKEIVKAYLPAGPGVEDRLQALKSYIDSLSTLFPDIDKPEFTTSTIVDPDWGEQWKKYFKPLRVSKNIIIKPTWERYTAEGRDVVIDIDPGMAFGTGQHPSTRMCIIALEDIFLKDRSQGGWNVLDIGTGTGILAICAAKLGADRVKAIDIDQKAVDIAGVNIAINDVEDRIELISGDIANFDNTFNLIVANLTAATLINIHPHLMPMLEPGGYLIASGIIDQNRESIDKIFLSGDLELHELKSEREWLCYVFQKRKGDS